MRLNAVRGANAMALSQLVLGILFTAATYAFPDFAIRLARAFVQPLDISPLVPAMIPPIEWGELMLGLVGWTVLVWVSGWFAVACYNWLSRGEGQPAGATKP